MSLRRPILLGLLACTTSVCRAPSTPAPATDEELALSRIRSRAEALLARQTEHQWRAWALGETVGSALAPDAWLVSPATIDQVRRAVHRAEASDNRRAWLAVHRLLVGEHLQAELTAHNARLATLEQVVPTGEDRIGFAAVSATLQLEPDPVRRRQIAESFQPQLLELATLALERQHRLADIGLRLGYRDRSRLATTLRGYPVQDATALAERLLANSEALYQSALAELAPRRCALPVAKLRRPDLPRLLPLAELPDGPAPWDAVLASLTSMGLSPDAAGIQLDLRATPGKNPRAATFPLRVPGDVRISLSPTGTLQDVPLLLHELGHALHFAHTRVPLFEFAQLGDGSVAEGFAFLFEGLADDPEWLATTFAIEEPLLTELVRHAGLRRLFTARRHAGRLLFAEALWQQPRADPATLFTQHLGRAYGITLDRADAWWWPVELEEFAESADYLRGQLFATALERFLNRRFGAPWWRQATAVAWLRELWSTGQRDPLPALLSQLDLDTLPFEPLMTSSAEALLRDARFAAAHEDPEAP